MNDTVLIVDDSLTVRMDLAEAFTAAGLPVVPCATLGEAREVLAHQPVGIVVLDVLLPDGDGVDLLREIRSSAEAPGPAVLMLSSEAEVKSRVRGLKTGADEYVGKPYEAGYVVARARQLLGSRLGTGAARRPTILVIDDSVTFRGELRRGLEEAGYAVLEAGYGEEGLRLAADRRPSAIVVDGVLPGIDGATVIRRLRLDTALRRVPCLLLTASEGDGAELKALDAGADAFVRKEEAMEVILARLAAALRRHADADAATEGVLGPKRILAVDDSLTYLHELAAALAGEGYEVVLAQSGEEALELLGVQGVDCVLLDLLMPGLSGQETCARIKAVPGLREIPLLMLTAVEDRATMLDSLASGADDYVQKSSELEVLKARVRAQLRRKQFEDETRRIRETLLQKEIEATEARGARELAHTRAILVAELERKNKDLEAFSYSVSHDLRAPLRGIDGFSQALLEDYASILDGRGQDYLRRVRAAAQRMGELIDDLLQLSRVGRAALHRQAVDLSALAREVAGELRRHDPGREVGIEVEDGLALDADRQLLRIVLENLLGNAWKFSAKVDQAAIEVGATSSPGGEVYFVRDNGAGFDMGYAEKLFRPFQRLHSVADFPGTGIGLATVYRIIDRHGGRVWAEGAVGAGATFFFSIPQPRGAER